MSKLSQRRRCNDCGAPREEEDQIHCFVCWERKQKEKSFCPIHEAHCDCFYEGSQIGEAIGRLDGRLLHGLTVIDFLRSKHMAGWELDAGMRSGDCKLIAEKIVEELEDKSPRRA
jgi:hypothetical protein